jgi:hypothetical protein
MMTMMTTNSKGEERDEIARMIAPWLRACVEKGLLKVWLSDKAPDHIKELYRNCYS